MFASVSWQPKESISRVCLLKVRWKWDERARTRLRLRLAADSYTYKCTHFVFAVYLYSLYFIHSFLFSFFSSSEIRNGNLKAILGLFFSLSRYKQQQQHAQRQPSLPSNAQSKSSHPPLSQQCSAPAQLSHSPHGTPVLTGQKAAQSEMQSRYSKSRGVAYFFKIFPSLIFWLFLRL